DAMLDGSPLRAEVTFAEGSVTGWAEFEDSRFDGSLVIDPDGECSRFEVTVDGDTDAGCLEDDVSAAEVEALAMALTQYEDLSLPTPTLVTTRTDGEWYFSPLLSISNAVLAYLRTTDADTVARQIDLFQEIMGRQL